MTVFGLYGSSKYARSSSVNSTFKASATIRSAHWIREGALELTDHFLKVVQLGSSNDRGSGLLRTPGERDLCHLNALLVGKFPDTKGRCSTNSAER